MDWGEAGDFCYMDAFCAQRDGMALGERDGV